VKCFNTFVPLNQNKEIMKTLTVSIHFTFADDITDVKSVTQQVAKAIENHIDHSDAGIVGDNDTYTKAFSVSVDGLELNHVIYEM
jgi:small-conductance mechanosensitive channel